MIIKDLNLIGFGQFNNKLIKLEDGLNIVYGENEAGKTTIHNFINGMFYGFIKPYSKRTIYTEEHGKYMPWNNSRYSGIVKFIYDGKEYRIEREFSRNKESTNVFIDSTGEDITNSIDNGDSGRVLQPGNHFFGFNDAVFSNTLSIKQLGNKTESFLANEVRDKLINVSTALDDNLSVEKATESLNSSIKEIGTTRAVTSPYGRSFERLNTLKSKRESINALKSEYDLLLTKKEDYDKELLNQNKNFKDLEVRFENAKILSKNRLYIEVKDLKERIEDLEVESKTYEKFKDLSFKDYSLGVELNSRINTKEEKINEYKTTLLQIEKKIEELKSNEVEVSDSLINIEVDYNKYEELEEEKNSLKHSEYGNKLQFLERDKSGILKSKGDLTFGIIGSLIGIFLSLGISVATSNYLILFLNALLIPLILFLFVKLRNTKSLLIRIEEQYKDIEKSEDDRIKNTNSINSTLKDILGKYEVNSKLELKRLLDNSRYIIFNREQMDISLRDNIRNKEELIEKLDGTRLEKEVLNREFENLLKHNSVDCLDEFKAGLETKKIYDDILSELTSKKDMFNRVLNGLDFEKLEEEIIRYKEFDLNTNEDLSINEINDLLNIKKDEINNIKVEISRYEEGINRLNNEISTLVEIDEEISRLENSLTKWDNKIKSLELAKSTIENISKDIHHQFAPMINQKVGDIIEDITDGKYTSVRIDNKLEIGVINPETKEMIDMANLSGGTIDQIYFALRFGIIDSINNESLPLILDDCFVQYDDIRLKNILGFLYEKSKERQIILFTCHGREKRILDEMNAKYNIINLNN